MKNFVRSAAICVAIIPSTVLAESNDWLKKDDPNGLFVSTFVHDKCPISAKNVDKLVKGVMVRSRIKPEDGFNPNETFLKVSLDCLKLEGNNPVFSSTVRFERVRVAEDGDLLYTHKIKDYGSLGIGGKAFITQSLKDSTEAAITEYLKVNFDLGED